jgi:hypothetical protein
MNPLTEAFKVSRSITDGMKKAGHPITETQQVMLTGMLAVWVEKILIKASKPE